MDVITDKKQPQAAMWVILAEADASQPSPNANSTCRMVAHCLLAAKFPQTTALRFSGSGIEGLLVESKSSLQLVAFSLVRFPRDSWAGHQLQKAPLAEFLSAW